jgi:N-acetylglucosamine kinase-like BadF-type ATPase
MDMTKIFLGIDIGSTSSHALLTDEDGHILAFSDAGPGNHEVVGYDGLQTVLQQLTSDVLVSADVEKEKVYGAGFGISGYDWSSEYAQTMEAIQALGLSAQIEWVNDTLLGLIAGSEQGWGIAVVAGSGENCWGRDPQGRIGRMTGRGSLMGEYGGAYAIASKAIEVVSAEWSQRGPTTLLTQVLLEVTGAQDRDDLIEGLCQGCYHVGAEITPRVFQAAVDRDIVAQGIIEWAAEELASLAIGVVHQLDFQHTTFDLVEMGGVFKAGKLLTDPFHAAVLEEAPGARFVTLNVPPVLGAVLLAAENTDVDQSYLRAQLNKNREWF